MSFLRNVWFSEFLEITWYSLSLFFVFPRLLVSFCRFGGKWICGQTLRKKVRAKAGHFTSPTHIQATSHNTSSPPMTLHIHLPPNHTIPSHTRTRLSHLPPHHTILLPPGHILHTACQNFWFNSVPQIFLSERVLRTPVRESALPECESPPWRFTNNSLGLPLAHSFSVCLSSWVYVVCVCLLLYLSIYLCFARCVFSVLLIFIVPFSIPKHTSLWMSLFP